MKKLEITTSTAASAGVQAEAAHRGRVLIVEDSESSRAMICSHLRDECFDYDEAENGAVAVEKIKMARFDLILMDIKMPMMDGHEAMRRIRQLEQSRGLGRTPIIAFTASSFEEDVQQAIENGADLHIAKPVKKDTLVAAIESLIRIEDHNGARRKHTA